MQKFIKVIISIAISFSVSFYAAFVAMRVYNWFIPAATGFKEIGYWLAYGICLVVEVFTLEISNTKDNDDLDDILSKSLVHSLVKVTILSLILGVAALVQLGV